MKKITGWLGMWFCTYFGLLTLLRWEWEWLMGLFYLGGLLGMGLVWIDRLVYVYYTRPHEQLSVQVRHLIQTRRYRDAYTVLKLRKKEQQQLVVRSVLFMGVWIPVAFFIVSSTASLLAQGFVMGIGLHLLFDLYQDWGNKIQLRTWLYWPIRRTVSDTELKVVTGVYAGFFLLLSLFMI